MSAAILLPRIMRVGAGASQQLPEVLHQLNIQNPLVVTAEFAIERGHVETVLAPLEDAGITCTLFSDVPADPTVSAVNKGIEVLQAQDFDGVIAIGGGSAIDSAKAIAVCGVHGGDIADYKMPAQTNAPGLPLIAVPTTAGTGSEVTKVTIITDDDSDEKMLLMGIAFQPIAALIDYELTLTKPFRLIADTGIDSLTHAIEAYVSQKANPFSNGLALSAMNIIYANIRTACEEPDNMQAREAMMVGATQAGMAFSNSSVALVHGMSRPIGAHFHVPHGLSNAMLLPAVTEFSIPAARERYADCARAMGIVDATACDQVACTQLVDTLTRLNKDLKVPTPEEYGIDPGEYSRLLPTMAQQALDSGSPGNNPRQANANEIKALYQQIFQAGQCH